MTGRSSRGRSRPVAPINVAPPERWGRGDGNLLCHSSGTDRASALHRRLEADHGEGGLDLLDAVRFLVRGAQGLAFAAQRQRFLIVLVGLVLRFGLLELRAECRALL